jgi:LysM repeat protein
VETKPEKIETKAAETNVASNSTAKSQDKLLADNSSARSSAAKYVTHKIKGGETLYTISKKHGVSINQLLDLNGLSRSSTLSIGQVLKVKPVKE